MTSPPVRRWRWLRRAVIFVLGVSVTLVGVLMVVTPGPAIVVVPLGLMILATEFAWARVLLARLRERIERLTATGAPRTAPPPHPEAPEAVAGSPGPPADPPAA